MVALQERTTNKAGSFLLMDDMMADGLIGGGDQWVDGSRMLVACEDFEGVTNYSWRHACDDNLISDVQRWNRR